MPNKNHKKPAKPIRSRRKKQRANGKAKAPSRKAKKAPAVAAVLGPERLRELYVSMLKCRMLQETVTERNHLQHAAVANREALLAGAMAHVIAGDAIVTAQDAFLASFMKGTPLTSILSQLRPAVHSGAENFTTAQNGAGSLALTTLDRGTTLAGERKGSATVVVVFAGESREARSALHENLRAAAKSKLPMVCVVEAGLVEAGHSPSPGTDAPQAKANASGNADDHFPQIVVDGVDAVAMFRVSQEAVRRARAGHGPSLIECVMPGNSAPRRAARAGNQEALDPLLFMQQYLKRKSLWSDEWRLAIVNEFGRALSAAFVSAQNPGDSERQFDHVYSPDSAPAPSSRATRLPDNAVPSRV